MSNEKNAALYGPTVTMLLWREVGFGISPEQLCGIFDLPAPSQSDDPIAWWEELLCDWCGRANCSLISTHAPVLPVAIRPIGRPCITTLQGQQMLFIPLTIDLPSGDELHMAFQLPGSWLQELPARYTTCLRRIDAQEGGCDACG
jgi:hypothetical protein